MRALTVETEQFCERSTSPVILLTGGRGRIGGAIQAVKSRRGHVRSFSRTPGEGHDHLQDLLNGLGPLHAEALIHGAWSTVPATAEENPKAFEQVDLPLMQRLITRLQRDPAPPLFIFLSTGAVYGSAPGRASRETDPAHPIGTYANGKLLGECLLRDSQLPYCVLRVGSVYSLQSTPQDAQGVIAHLVRCALSGAVFHRWGGDSVKDYLHCSDFLEALWLIIDQRLTGTWNLGSGTGISLTTLIERVEIITGRALKIEQQPTRHWDVLDNRLDVTCIREKLSWQARISIDEGIKNEVARARRM